MESCTMLGSCNCSQCIDWNAPLCQLCFSNRCEIKSFPDYETYCASCVPRDKETIVFIIGDMKKKIITRRDIIKTQTNSLFALLLNDGNIKRDDDHVFEVPLNLKFLNEIERALQGHEVITEYENEDLKNELYFFTGWENIELLFESEDLCSCGNRRYKKNSKCKECHENLLKEHAPICRLCREEKVGWDKGRKRYFNLCRNCGREQISCNMCKSGKKYWDHSKRAYLDKCKMCIDFIERNNSKLDLEITCEKCSNKWGQIVKHVKDRHC
ncbi:23831_t:CDS:1 [Racocetra persica]|uniref:23831_t:CDS:1 n=1 Tax=Racocetra persica TaxID=160502 RepID=A0ACA9QML3_9GLOM|nr:23831_t:CDS:1 [Racocetra persica]